MGVLVFAATLLDYRKGDITGMGVTSSGEVDLDPMGTPGTLSHCTVVFRAFLSNQAFCGLPPRKKWFPCDFLFNINKQGGAQKLHPGVPL